MALGGDDSAKARELLHELRNVLGLVITYTSLLGDELKDRPGALQDLHEVRNAGERATELVHQLSAFLRPGAI